MSASILHLPFDIVDGIGRYLTVQDYTCLSLVNHKFWGDLKRDGTARKCLQNNLSHAAGTQEVLRNTDPSGSRECLSSISSRNQALRTASPYSATLLAYATCYVFDGGIVCYTTASSRSDEIRILDLSHGPPTEKVIDLRYLAQKTAVPGESASCDLRSLTITGFKHSIITIVCDFGPTTGPYLFAMNVAESVSTRRVLFCESLRSTNKIFVRHNSKYLYYGTHSATGSHSYREWLIQGFDLSSGKALTQQPIQLYNFAGSDLYSVVDFVIHDGYFYAITNQTSFESEEINWTSYFCYVSFPAHATEPDVKLRTAWRRQDAEGPINDSWTRLLFDIDPGSGKLLFLEVRKEWLNGGSSQLRTCYIQPWATALHGQWDQRATANLADRLSLAVEKTDRPRFEARVPPRIDKYCHHEFHPSYTSERYEYLNSKTKWSSYSYANDTFVDLVVDDVEVADSWRPKERLRLRVVSRKTCSPLDDPFAPSNLRQQLYHDGELMEGSEEVYTASEVFKWPPPKTKLPDELEEMMCPGGKAGEVQAVLGEEGIIYMGGAPDENGQRALVYLSFDPSFVFNGMKRLNGSFAKPRLKEGTHESQSGQKRTSSFFTSSVDVHEEAKSPKKTKTMAQAPVAGEDEAVTDHGLCNPPDTVQSEKGTADSALSAETKRKEQVGGQVVRERLLYRTKARFLSLQQGWWLR